MDRSGKTNKTNREEDEDPFKIGTVLFSAGGNNAKDVWDDSDLIDHWDRNIEVFRSRYSNQPQEQTDNDDPPFQQTKRNKTQAGHITKKKPVLRKKLNMQHSYQSQTSNTLPSVNKESSQEIPSQSINEQPASFTPVMPPMPPMPSNQGR
ncbi:hypothetical protein EDC94DRAFT_663735 [Helicostylum pulchrum]|nr:hypothetical protein EDC94DRAFT_663735 [Helicostylum pulchrum]